MGGSDRQRDLVLQTADLLKGHDRGALPVFERVDVGAVGQRRSSGESHPHVQESGTKLLSNVPDRECFEGVQRIRKHQAHCSHEKYVT